MEAQVETDEGRSQPLIPGLLDDLAIMCLIRVPRAYHRSLRLVSSGWAQLLDSGELCRRRRQCGVAEAWVYVRSRDGAYRNYWRAFDTTTHTWHPLPPLPPLLLPGEGASAAENAMQVRGLGSAAVGGKLYVFGGWREGGPALQCTWCYDPCSDRWERRADMRVARCYMASAVLSAADAAAAAAAAADGGDGGRISELGRTGEGEEGGGNGGSETRGAESICSPRTRTSTSDGGSDGGVILVAGGMVRPRLHPSELLVAAEQYDVARDEWTALPPMPQPMLFSSGVTLGGRFLVSGNFTDEGQWGAVYSPGERVWRPIAHRSLATALLSPCAALPSPQGDLLFCIKDALQVWSPWKREWQLVEGEGRIFSDTRFPCWVCCMAFVAGRLFLVHQNCSLTTVTLSLHHAAPTPTAAATAAAAAPAAQPAAAAAAPGGSGSSAHPASPRSVSATVGAADGSVPDSPAAAAPRAVATIEPRAAAGAPAASAPAPGNAVASASAAAAGTAGERRGIDERVGEAAAVAEGETAAERAMREVAEAVAAAEAVGVPSAVAPAAGHVAGQISAAVAAAGARAWQQGRGVGWAGAGEDAGGVAGGATGVGAGEGMQGAGEELRDLLVSPSGFGTGGRGGATAGGEGTPVVHWTGLGGLESETVREGGEGSSEGWWWGERLGRSVGGARGKRQQVEVRVEEVMRVSEGVAADDEQAIDCYVLEA